MEIFGLTLVCFGFLIIAVCQTWLLVIIFKKNKIWFAACFITSLAGLGFLMTHWNIAKKPFLLQFIGWAAFYIGGAVVQSVTKLNSSFLTMSPLNAFFA